MEPIPDILDQLLPLLQSQRVEVHENVAVLEVTDRAQLAELAANPRIRRYLLARLSDTVALIDPGHEETLAKALRAEGHMPKNLKGIAE